MKKLLPPVVVSKPCPRRWEEMRGGDSRRFCEHCQLHVHNLSAMPAAQRDRFVAESAGRLCVAYELREDGSMVTAPRFPRIAKWGGRVMRVCGWIVAIVVPMAAAGCADRRTLGRVSPNLLGKPMPPAQAKADCQRMTLGEAPARSPQAPNRVIGR